jgi:DNA-binding PadR family transcriptional regulator
MPKRFFQHGELPLVLLALLEQREMHAYDVMTELGRLFGPRYRASPGTVYPAVDALEAEGLIEGARDGAKTVYRPTSEGAEALASRADALTRIELRTGARLREDAALEIALTHFDARVRALSGRVDPEQVAAVLERAAMDIESLDGLEVEVAR